MTIVGQYWGEGGLLKRGSFTQSIGTHFCLGLGLLTISVFCYGSFRSVVTEPPGSPSPGSCWSSNLNIVAGHAIRATEIPSGCCIPDLWNLVLVSLHSFFSIDRTIGVYHLYFDSFSWYRQFLPLLFGYNPQKLKKSQDLTNELRMNKFKHGWRGANINIKESL